MTPLEQCLTSLLEVTKADDLSGLSSVDRFVQLYLASPESPQGIAHPCDDLAEIFMKRAPDTELKGHILDKLFSVERKTTTVE